MKTSLVPREHIPVVWDSIKGFAERCAKYTFGRFTAEDMLEGLLTKDQQLWIAFDDEGIHAFWVTEVITYPQIKTLVMHFVGGRDIEEWQTVGLSQLQKFARDTGCSKIESYGRPGWEKIWKEQGYEKRLVFYELPVE
jgi:effector-binding domain-containing protein